MKSTFLTLALIFSSLNGFSQSVFRLDANGLGVPQFATNPTCAVADKGKVIYNTTQEKLLYCNGTAWIDPATGGVPNNWVNSGNNSYLSNLGGKVGIGTNNPVAPLTIYNSSSASTNYLTSTTGTSSTDGLYVGYYNGLSYFYNFENTDITIATNGIEGIRVSAAGNIGIGTSSPSQKLDVVGNAEISGNLTVNNGAGVVRSDDATQMVILDYATPANINFSLAAGGLIGPIGIGFSTFTSTPAIAFGDTFGISNPQNLVFTIESVTTTSANIWVKNIGSSTSVATNAVIKAIIIGKK